ERLVETHLGQDRGEAAGEHRLPGSGRPNHQGYIISRPLTRAWDMVKAKPKTSLPPKAYSYIRWSTPEQSKGDSSRRQTEAARRYCAQHGLMLDDSTYRDAGISAFKGKNLESGALGQFLEAARAGIVPAGSTLLIEKLDRLTRLPPLKALNVLSALCDLGITVVTLGDGRGHTAESIERDHMGTLMSFILLIRGREESETKSERVGAAVQAKRDTASDKPLTKPTSEWMPLHGNSGTLNLVRCTSPLRGRHTEVKSLFAGLARCPKCGETMTRVYKGKPPKGGVYLACVDAKEGRGCEYRAVRYEPVEAALLRDADRVLNDAPSGDTGIDKVVTDTESLLHHLHDQAE